MTSPLPPGPSATSSPASALAAPGSTRTAAGAPGAPSISLSPFSSRTVRVVAPWAPAAGPAAAALAAVAPAALAASAAAVRTTPKRAVARRAGRLRTLPPWWSARASPPGRWLTGLPLCLHSRLVCKMESLGLAGQRRAEGDRTGGGEVSLGRPAAGPGDRYARQYRDLALVGHAHRQPAAVDHQDAPRCPAGPCHSGGDTQNLPGQCAARYPARAPWPAWSRPWPGTPG